MKPVVRETRNSILEYSNHILKVRLKEFAEITEETMLEQFEMQSKMVGIEEYAVLVDGRLNSSPTPEARRLMANHKPKNRVATAIVTNNNIATLFVANFYLKVNKPSIPTRVFKSENKAMAWLKRNLDNHKS